MKYMLDTNTLIYFIKNKPPSIAARIDAVVAAYGERIANIERQKMENRDELRSLGAARQLARSTLLSYSRV